MTESSARAGQRSPFIAALVAYDGTRFAGFQRQAPERGPTVQGELEAALTRLLGEPVGIEAAGRTDAGVHASAQVISFQPGAARIPVDRWVAACNAHLPSDIALRGACAVPDGFRARRSALARRYRYRVFRDSRRDPLRERYAWRVVQPLDLAAMDEAAQTLLGEHDFGAFGSSPRDSRAEGIRGHTVRRMTEARVLAEPPHSGVVSPVDEHESEIGFVFTANAFLTGMVRQLVGTLALVGTGRLTVADFRAILDTRAKQHPGAAAPPQGLSLIGVEYPAGTVSW